MTQETNLGGDSCEVRFGGLGGQGIVLAGQLLGKAAALYDGQEAVCTQTYGPEARGGASRTDVIISSRPVDYPFVIEADVLAVLFQEAYTRFRPSLRNRGLLIFDSGLVQPRDEGAGAHGIAATEIAERMGNRMVANVVVLGYLVALSGVVSTASVEQAIRATVKPAHVDLDIEALATGASLALERSEA